MPISKEYVDWLLAPKIAEIQKAVAAQEKKLKPEETFRSDYGYALDEISGLGSDVLRKYINKINAGKTKQIQENMNLQTKYMMKILLRHVRQFVPDIGVKDMAFRVINKHDGTFAARIGFAYDAIFRPSVEQDPEYAKRWNRYGELNGKFGTDDIVLQLTKGYAARDSIKYQEAESGDWRWTRQSYTPPSDFVANAVEEFNDLATSLDPSLMSLDDTTKKKYRLPSQAVLVGDYA